MSFLQKIVLLFIICINTNSIELDKDLIMDMSYWNTKVVLETQEAKDSFTDL